MAIRIKFDCLSFWTWSSCTRYNCVWSKWEFFTGDCCCCFKLIWNENFKYACCRKCIKSCKIDNQVDWLWNNFIRSSQVHIQKWTWSQIVKSTKVYKGSFIHQEIKFIKRLNFEITNRSSCGRILNSSNINQGWSISQLHVFDLKNIRSCKSSTCVSWIIHSCICNAIRTWDSQIWWKSNIDWPILSELIILSKVNWDVCHLTCLETRWVCTF